MEPTDLIIIVPVYNEEVSIERMIHEWVPQLRQLKASAKIYVLNDGSKDQTQEKLLALKSQYPGELEIFEHANRGHGQTCRRGYMLALEAKAAWILQIDSDGQCDARYLAEFWQSRLRHKVIYGLRTSRADGELRRYISRIVSLVVFAGTGTWVKDANVPYRLIDRSILADVITKVPEDFYLANVLLTALLQKASPIFWIPIHFRDRFGGSPSVKVSQFAKHGLTLLLQLRRIR